MLEAGTIVREEIRSKLYETDKYPATIDLFLGAEDDVPECLSIFLEEVFYQEKRKVMPVTARKQSLLLRDQSKRLHDQGVSCRQLCLMLDV